MKVSFKGLALGTVIAGAAGYLAGLLTAPKSGKDTRGDIRHAANNTITHAEKQLKRAHTELSDLLDEAKDRGGKARGRARAQYDDVTDQAASARQKIREIISAIHEGDADNKDLKKALADAQKATKHLRDYLKK